MAKAIKLEGNRVSFKCLGCDEMHTVPVGAGGWGFNDDVEKPTLTPSVLVRSGHFMPSHKDTDPCWCGMPDAGFNCVQCHTFVTEGRIQYLGDCSHALAGQTIELPDVGD